MSNINDAKKAALEIFTGRTGGVTDLEYWWLQGLTGLANHGTNDMYTAWMDDEGITAGQIDSRLYEFLGTFGYTGSINDRWKEFWEKSFPLFNADWQSSLTPTISGAPTPTATRATTATVWGFASDAVTGASPILLSVASGEARFKGARRISEGVWSTDLADGAPINLTNTTGASLYVDANGPFGYMSEAQAINKALHSRVWEDVVWSATNVTVADDTIAGIDGLTRAATLTATAANGTVIQDLGVIGSTAQAWGLWIKRKTGTGDIELTQDGGSTWATVTVTAGWTRVEVTETLADPDIGIRIVTDTDAIYVDYAQSEAGTFLTSSTPEVIATPITRNADILTYPSAGNVSILDGTLFSEYRPDGPPSSWNVLGTSGATYGAGRGMLMRAANSSAIACGGNSSSDNISGLSLTDGNVHSIAMPYSVSATRAEAFSDGAGSGSPITDFDFTGSGMTVINVGQLDPTGAGHFNGTIREGWIFQRDLTTTELAAFEGRVR